MRQKEIHFITVNWIWFKEKGQTLFEIIVEEDYFK